MIYRIFVFLTFMVFPLVGTFASPTSNTGGSTVTEGRLAIEGRVGFNNDDESASSDNRLQFREVIDYGFTDYYALRLITVQNKRESEDLEHSSFRIENRFQLIERKDHGWDAGVRITYNSRDSGPDEIEMRLVTQVPFGDGWQHRQNVFFEHDLGDDRNSGIGFESRSEVNKKIGDIRLGVEMFNDFGNLSEQSGYSAQEHEIGPVARGKLPESFYYIAGLRQGISRSAPDQTLKFTFGKSF